MVVSDQRRAFGVFFSRQDTEQALNELKASGFSMDNVSIIAKQADQDEQLGGAKMSDQVGNQDVGAPTGVVADTLAGATWGSILVGLGSLAIPGGVIVAAGSVGAALAATTASTGIAAAASGRLVRALTDLGIPEAQASIYGDRLLQSYYLLIVDGTEDEISRAETILRERDIKEWGIYDSPQT